MQARENLQSSFSRTMASSSPNSSSFLFLLFLLPLAYSDSLLPFHGGRLLTGNVKLSILWYGRFNHMQKEVILSFIKSLNYDRKLNLEPAVSKWWRVVESFQSEADEKLDKDPYIQVRVVREASDKSYSIGKDINKDALPKLVHNATDGDKNTVAVFFTARDVKMEGFCTEKCYEHGLIGASNQTYILVGNPEKQCPGTCAWPFHRPDSGPHGVTLQPPNGNMGADAMVISFATALAGLVTNPYNDGFYAGSESKPLEIATICKGMFGTGAFLGYPGRIRINPGNGGCFNAHGSDGKKFLLPGLWNPKTSFCWTTM